MLSNADIAFLFCAIPVFIFEYAQFFFSFSDPDDVSSSTSTPKKLKAKEQFQNNRKKQIKVSQRKDVITNVPQSNEIFASQNLKAKPTLWDTKHIQTGLVTMRHKQH